MGAPILQGVNSYDVHEGTTIDFYANHGTNLVVGSRLTITDVKNNILATHIYIPKTYDEASIQHYLPSKTALINLTELPANYDETVTYSKDDVVAYEGATFVCLVSAPESPPSNGNEWKCVAKTTNVTTSIFNDFETKYNNETQYKYIINVFIGFTLSGSGIALTGLSANSNISSTWTLPQPSVYIDTIGTDGEIATTSQVITITYNTNITSEIVSTVFNPPQDMTVDLYKYEDGTSTLVQSSGKMYNSGIITSSNEYVLNYNIEGLSNGITYYIVVTINTILGMTVVQRSNSFLVNARTYEIYAFSVENEACEGRIKITSHASTIPAETTATIVDGGVDLTDGNTVSWQGGLAFSNNWTLRFWGYDFNISDGSSTEQSIIHLGSTSNLGVIDVYMFQDSGDDTKVYAALYIHPIGYSGVTRYYYSNSISAADITAETPACIVIAYDYTEDLYQISLSV